jgi:hypothetical protein
MIITIAPMVNVSCPIRVNAKFLPDFHNSGYAGKGYGGDKLFCTWLQDCAFPNFYLVRADSWEDAFEVAQECLSETLDAMTAMECAEMDILTYSPSGRQICSEDDIRVIEIRIPKCARANSLV